MAGPGFTATVGESQQVASSYGTAVAVGGGEQPEGGRELGTSGSAFRRPLTSFDLTASCPCRQPFPMSSSASPSASAPSTDLLLRALLKRFDEEHGLLHYLPPNTCGVEYSSGGKTFVCCRASDPQYASPATDPADGQIVVGPRCQHHRNSTASQWGHGQCILTLEHDASSNPSGRHSSGKQN